MRVNSPAEQKMQYTIIKMVDFYISAFKSVSTEFSVRAYGFRRYNSTGWLAASCYFFNFFPLFRDL